MKHDLHELLANNRAWAKQTEADNPGFFRRLAKQQSPKYLWIGCADSRVPANQIVGLAPGEIFVHRNIANVVVPSDLNCLSVLQFAVEVLKVQHIIVCGHFGCSGVKAALEHERHGLVDHWLRHVYDVAIRHADYLKGLSPKKKLDRMCELNVIDQVKDVGNTVIVRDAWERGQELTLHGWIYDIHDGLVQDLQLDIDSAREMRPAIESALKQLAKKSI